MGGVCALLAERFGVDVVWIRLGFVVLALVGGFGVIAYAGLWLALVAGPATGKGWVRVVGGIIVALGLPWALQSGAFTVWSGQLAVVALLIGIAIVLWQPRWKAEPTSAPTLLPPPAMPPAAPAAPPRPEPAAPAPKPPRQRSLLGRTTLGMALIVAAGGALIDSMTGRRLHPEQWLGAAALVCAGGLVVGAFAGRARWLIVPAALFSVAGLVAGEFARLGVAAGDAFDGRGLYISGSGGVWGYQSIESGFDDLWVTIDRDIPDAGATVRARSVFGDIFVGVPDSVTVEVRARSDHGTVRIDGATRPNGTYTVGPEGQAAVVVDARSGWGDVEVMTQWYEDVAIPETVAPVVDDLGSLTPVADYVSATSDGWFVLVNGEAVIDDHNELVVGDAYEPDPYFAEPSSEFSGDASSDVLVSVPSDIASSSLTIPTSVGEFRLLPRGLLVTPWQTVLDLVALRQQLTPPASATTVPEIEPPGPSQPAATTTTIGAQP